MNTKKKNALIIAYNDLNNSGVPNVIYQTIKALHSDYNFDIVVFGDNLFYLDKMKEQGINNVSVIKFTNDIPKKRFYKLLWHLFYKNKSYMKQCENILSTKNYDVVHSFKEYDSWPFLKACKKYNIKKRILHGTVIHKKSGSLFNRYLLRKSKALSLRYSTSFVAVSEICGKSTFPKKHFEIIYNGYNASVFNDKVPNRLKDDELVLTQIGTFNDNKNQLFSLNVISEILKIHPNSRLKLIGKETGQGYAQRINDYVKLHHLEKHVDIIDGTNGVGNNLEFTTFTILPSHQEGAGITAIESQACGIIVFASNSVTKEMDVGGLVSLDLKLGAEFWARIIVEKFKKIGNQRQHYNLQRFSSEEFSKSIALIYK